MNTDSFFDHYFDNAQVNSILIMECNGTIQKVNKAFTNNFGYTSNDLFGQNFSVLFSDDERNRDKPKLELDAVLRKGQAHDETYIKDKNGDLNWCTGEALLTINSAGEKYIVKDVVNLQAKKQLDLFLSGTEELLESIFRSSKDIPMLIIDGSIKIQGVNKAFLELFDIGDVTAGKSLFSLNNPFWQDNELKRQFTHMVVSNEPVKRKHFTLEVSRASNKNIRIDSTIIHRQSGRKIFIVLEEIQN